METVAGVGGIDEAKLEDGAALKNSSAVYKLVRVKGDGRLVPATDEEVMEVEDMLDCDKSKMRIVVDSAQNRGYTSKIEFSSSKIELEGSEGLHMAENLEVDAEKINTLDDILENLGTANARVENVAPSVVPSSTDGDIDQSGGRECPSPIGVPIESGSTTSTVCTSWKPDFSKLKGEICLEKLSVRELHETFKATFGRETSVKDKQWLKRRIAMGFSNSCDVSTTSFTFEDSGVVTKGKKDSCQSVDCTSAEDTVIGGRHDNCGASVGDDEPMGDHMNVSGKILQSPSSEDTCANEDLHMEQRATKRVRKPTRRYIEEVSETESREYGLKLNSPIKNSGYSQPSPQGHVRPFQNVRLDARPLVTRQDSLGGSGVQVPYVSRIRRGRPRENLVALMELQPGNMGMAARVVNKALGVNNPCPQPNNERGNKVFKARMSPGWVQHPLIKKPKKDEQYFGRKANNLENNMELEDMGSSGDYSDDNASTLPAAIGGLRRKHHRPWTLSEVVKLVEGVAAYGAGRWSEIKRISFASYSYRTSVDLKDKWRNLLRASFTQLPAENGGPKKHASAPIPTSILLRVRELAEMEARVPRDLSFIKSTGHSGRRVQEKRSGYL
ncbi:hypothetical protein RJ639_036655 [Escallonia herrerae]|uniref:Uncharacterized protein n=1 Tax=Escallonia herrerae TaxID=1293975 RepID=A0AA89BBE3_9ASTE|nr:hypothetical protein RJ639_036655 [Escallonia herrerae]